MVPFRIELSLRIILICRERELLCKLCFEKKQARAHCCGPVADSSAEATKCGSRQRSSRSRLLAARLAYCRRASAQVHTRVTSRACGAEWSWAVVSGGGADESPERQRERSSLWVRTRSRMYSVLATSAVASLSPTLASSLNALLLASSMFNVREVRVCEHNKQSAARPYSLKHLARFATSCDSISK